MFSVLLVTTLVALVVAPIIVYASTYGHTAYN